MITLGHCSMSIVTLILRDPRSTRLHRNKRSPQPTAVELIGSSGQVWAASLIKRPEQTVPATNRAEADRVIWTGLGRVPDPEKDVPSIVVEFVSNRRRDALRDYEAKRDEYLAAGVEEYWVVDRFRRIMTVYRRGVAGPTFEIVTEHQTYQTKLLPGFVLLLSKLLAKADQWKKRKPSRPKHSRMPNPPSGGTDG